MTRSIQVQNVKDLLQELGERRTSRFTIRMMKSAAEYHLRAYHLGLDQRLGKSDALVLRRFI